MDTFHSTMGNAYLQKHILAVVPETVEPAVRAGNEFQQIKGHSSNPGRARSKYGEDESLGKVRVVKAAEDQMTQLLAAILKLTAEVTATRRPTGTGNKSGNKKGRVCRNCNQPGHLKPQWPEPRNQT